MTNWQRNLLDVLYIAMESIPWFTAITVIATIGERGFLGVLARQLRSQIAADFFQDPNEATAVADALAAQALVATAGPGLWVVALAAFGGFWLMRSLIQLRLSGPAGAAALVLATVFGLNVLLHLVFAENLLIWQNEGVATFIDNPQAFVASGADFDAVVERGGVVIGSATAITITFVGMVGVWLRFLYAGRRPVKFNHVLRSFGIGFAIILVSLVIARVNDVGQLAVYAVPFFMLGLMSLAVANGERAALPAEGRDRAASWGVAVAATLTLLVAVASVFGLLAALDVASVLSSLGGLFGTVIEWVLIIILTPIFWILVPLLEFLLPDALAERLNNLQVPENLVEPEVLEEGQTEDDFVFPRWPFDVLKLLIFVALVWLSYRVGRALLARRDSGLEDEFDEFRTEMAGGGGLGGLLRGLMRRGVRPSGSSWFHLNPVYGIYGRSVIDAEDRGFERRRSETPLEYSSASGSVLGAPVFGEIAEAFDAARYGGHDADPDQLRRWAAELEAWEAAHPATEELRDQLEQVRPPRDPRPVDPAKEFAERVKRGRAAFKQMRDGELADRVGGGEGKSPP